MALQFMNSIYDKAKKNVKTIAIPEVTNEYMTKAAAKATADGIANIILVGNPEDVTATAGKAGVDVSGIRVVDVNDTAYKEELLDRYNNSPDNHKTRSPSGKILPVACHLPVCSLKAASENHAVRQASLPPAGTPWSEDFVPLFRTGFS